MDIVSDKKQRKLGFSSGKMTKGDIHDSKVPDRKVRVKMH